MTRTSAAGEGSRSRPVAPATSTGTVTITATAGLPAGGSRFLRGGGTSFVGVLTGTAPAEPPTDWDGDGDPGLTVRKSDMKLTEDDSTKYQGWSYPVPAGGLDLDGPVSVRLWSSQRLQRSEAEDDAAWLWDRDASGLVCHPLASTVPVHVDRRTTTTSTGSARDGGERAPHAGRRPRPTAAARLRARQPVAAARRGPPSELLYETGS